MTTFIAVTMGMHLIGCFPQTIFGRFVINKTNIDIELVRQHHEKCFMLGLIALAIMVR